MRIVALLFGFLAFVAIIVALQWANFFSYQFWSPKYQDVQRETFERTRSYQEGAVRDAENLCLEYGRADEEHKKMLKIVITNRLSDYKGELPAHVQKCLNEIGY